MMRKTIPIYSCVFIFVILVSSCSDYSLFTGWDKPDTERISYYTGSNLLITLEKNRGSMTFYETMTPLQEDRIKQSLDAIIQAQDETVSAKLRASAAAVDLLIHTDELVYTVIYNLSDPFLEAISGNNANVASVFSFFMEPLQNKLAAGVDIRDALALFFLHLYEITVYYDPGLVRDARMGSYGGSDLQKYLVAAIVGSIIVSTWELVQDVWPDIEQSVFAVIDYIYKNIKNIDLQNLQSILEEFQKWIETQQPSRSGASDRASSGSANDIVKAYGAQLKIKAGVLGTIAENAGYKTIGDTVADILNKF